MKLTKVMAAALIGATLVTSVPLSAMAADSSTVTTTVANSKKVYMNKIAVTIPNADTVRIEKSHVINAEGKDEVILHIYDRLTGNLVETYGEISEKTGEVSAQAISIVTTYKEQNFGDSSYDILVRETMQLEVYKEGSFGQINSILNNSIAVVNGNNWTLEDKYSSAVSSSSTGKFPTASVTASGYGTLTKVITNKTEYGIVLGLQFGLSAIAGSSSQWYARKYAQVGFNYSV